MHATLLLSAVDGDFAQTAQEARARGHEVVVVGALTPEALLSLARQETTDALLVADTRRPLAEQLALLEPLALDTADVVIGRRARADLGSRLVGGLARGLVGLPLADPECPARAFRREALLHLDQAPDTWLQLLLTLQTDQFRFAELPVGAGRAPGELGEALAALGRQVLGRPDVSDSHEGYASLAHLETGASRYNAWLGEKFRAACGARVLEVGAGIGTITAQLEAGRERVVALELEPAYVALLARRFRGSRVVEPWLTDVELADEGRLRAERFDTVVLSNVLEHLRDDGGTLARFARLLPSRGRVVVFVPALPSLFGSLDTAVGHHRRYTPESLTAVLEGAGLRVATLEWVNLVGIPGWWFNGAILKRREMPPVQTRLYDRLAPLLSRLESKVRLPVGLSLFAIAEVP
jgi:SAM-dependent methyltransferase